MKHLRAAILNKGLYISRVAAFCGIAIAVATSVWAEEHAATSESAAQIIEQVNRSVARSLLDQLQASYPGARVRLLEDISWKQGAVPPSVSNVILLRENALGEAYFVARTPRGDIEGAAHFIAEAKAWVPLRRVLPGEALRPDDLKLQDVAVSQGFAREYRGLLLSPAADIATLEARQTLLEGQYLVSSAVQRIPDAKRGDTLRIQMRSGDVVLSTTGTAEEPAYLDGPIRVMIQKSKRSLSGKLVAKGTVEVSL